jgi:hypothetical protein
MRSVATKRVLFASCLLSFVFVVGCNGQAGDALSSLASGSLPSRPALTGTPSISLPTSEAPVPTEEPTVEPTVEPTQQPTVEPTEEPTVEPTEEPTVGATEDPIPTEGPASSEVAPSAEPAPEGKASTGASAAIWWALGFLVVVLIAVLVMRSRRRPSATLQQAYAATVAVRDRLAQEVSMPSVVPGTLEALVEEADRALRAVGVAATDEPTPMAVEQTLRAVADAREGAALRTATAGAAHASGADVETQLLRALAALDAALGPLREAAGGPSTTGFEA